MLCAFLVACCDLIYPMIAKDIINVYVPDRNLRLVIVWAVVLLVIYVLFFCKDEKKEGQDGADLSDGQ